MKLNKLLLSGLITILSFGAVHGQIQSDPILLSMKKEVDRNKAGLHVGTLATPFWISARFLNTEYLNVSAVNGDIVNQNSAPENMGSTNVLVGDYKRNNNNTQSSNSFNDRRFYVGNTNLESALAYEIWGQLDPAYKSAAESLERKKVQITQQNIAEEELAIPDWDQSTPVQYYEKQVSQKLDMNYWTDYCRKASLAIYSDSAIIGGDFRVIITQGDCYYYSTDGFMYRMPTRCIRMMGGAKCRTKDGQDLDRSYQYLYNDLSEVPSIVDLCTEIKKFNKLLVEESNAPVITDSYSGPVLFEGTAVSDAICQYFIYHSDGLLAKRKPLTQSEDMYGYSRQGNVGNPMEQMMNKKVADRRLDFISMTGTPQWNGKKLLGYTPIDAQGVKPDSSLVLIENGILKRMLSDRTPTKTNPKSNGHNLLKINSPNSELSLGVLRVKSSNTIPKKDLKDSLLAAAKDEGYDFAYIRRGYDHMSDIFVYKVYSDGHEEMVRNAMTDDLSQKKFKYINEISTEDCLYNTDVKDSKGSLIVPYGLIFKELGIVRNNDVKKNKPFILPRPVRKNKK